MKALLVVCALGGVAHADYLADADEPVTHKDLLGFRIGGGIQPVDDRDLTQMSLAIMVEHHIYHRLRMVGEYEYVGLTEYDGDMKISDGTGHRANLILRHPLARSKIFAKTMRLWMDVEVGGGFLLADDSVSGTIAKPHVVGGIRLGYDFIKFVDDSRASKVWEPEVVFRVFAMPYERVGFMFGIGMNWGD